MRHSNVNRKFGRPANQRRALLRALALSLFERGKITTTLAKAKELRPFAEKLLTLGKRGTPTARKLLASRLYNNREIVKKLCDDIAPKYADRAGGYTRVTKLTRRLSDGSAMAVIEFV